MANEYDLIIIGGGPAAYASSLYASRYKIKHAIIAKQLGGTLQEAWEIENYLGFSNILGPELNKRFLEHVKKYGPEIFEGYEAIKIEKDGQDFKVFTDFGEVFKAKALIIATGAKKRKLGVPGEEKLQGKGVSYCVTCDGPLFKDKDVVIVGGGDAGVTSAVMLSKYAKNITIIEKFKVKAEPINFERLKPLMEEGKVKIIEGQGVKEIKGEKFVEGIVLEDGKEIKCQGVFIEIGEVPNSKIAREVGVNVNEHGYIIVNRSMETNVPGIFAAGDVTDVPLKQIVTAVGEGTIAIFSAYKYLQKIKKPYAW